MSASAAAIDALLPQTQCRRCGYDGCRPYAEAIASGSAEINQCPPGGAATIDALANLLARRVLPLNPQYGSECEPLVAVIDEARCIGCAKCLPPCPVDAIIGSGRQMHTVLYASCTGCELCIAPCPVDCISLAPRSGLAVASRYLPPNTSNNRTRYQAHESRTARQAAERAALLAARKNAPLTPDSAPGA